ncbi:MAG: CinA family protein [Kiritimatiellia bacterium]
MSDATEGRARDGGSDVVAPDTSPFMRQAEILVALLKARGMTCATAESCTGGGVGHAITAVPGSSEVYWGGVISYDNSVKRTVLGVAEETLATVGAVSHETAAQMAEGVRRLLKTDLAVSVTGIAGPGGGTSEKPVGLVWFGLATRTGVRTEKALFTGVRDEVRAKAVRHALGMLTMGAV